MMEAFYEIYNMRLRFDNCAMLGMSCMYPGLLDSADIEKDGGDGPRLSACDLKGRTGLLKWYDGQQSRSLPSEALTL
jgi:hypothetical protein